MRSKRLNSGDLGAARSVDYWVISRGGRRGHHLGGGLEEKRLPDGEVSVRDHFTEADTNVKCSGTLRRMLQTLCSRCLTHTELFHFKARGPNIPQEEAKESYQLDAQGYRPFIKSEVTR